MHLHYLFYRFNKIWNGCSPVIGLIKLHKSFITQLNEGENVDAIYSDFSNFNLKINTFSTETWTPNKLNSYNGFK